MEFNVDHYLKQAGLSPLDVWRVGEPSSVSRPDRLSRWSGFSMIASKAGFTEVDQQLDDAIDFLNRHEKALQQLAAYSGVEDAVLDFGIEDRDVGAQADYFRPELLLAMGRLKIGLVVSRYPCSKVKGVE